MEASGNLVITKLAASDQGRYVCVAQNTVGIRETSPVLLTVNGKRDSPSSSIKCTASALAHTLRLYPSCLGCLSWPPALSLMMKDNQANCAFHSSEERQQHTDRQTGVISFHRQMCVGGNLFVGRVNWGRHYFKKKILRLAVGLYLFF